MVRMCCPHFTDEQIEAQRGEACCLKTHSDSIWTQAQRTWTLKPSAPDLWARQYQKGLGTPNCSHLSSIPEMPRDLGLHTWMWRHLGLLI